MWISFDFESLSGLSLSEVSRYCFLARFFFLFFFFYEVTVLDVFCSPEMSNSSVSVSLIIDLSSCESSVTS